MEDDDIERSVVPPGSGIRYGEATLGTAEERAAAIAKGNIQTQVQNETLDLPEDSTQAKKLHEDAVKEMELRRRMRAAIVPTNVEQVKNALREMEEPATLFGERPDARRDRLRKLLADKTLEEQESILAPVMGMEIHDEAERQTEKFYTEGSQALRFARRQIAMWSLKKAQRRLQSAKRKRENPDEDELAELRDAESAMSRVAAQASEVGDNRPLTACQFSPDGLQLATASIAGTVKIWDVPDLNKTLTIGAHDTRVTGIAWRPEVDISENAVVLATGCTDSRASLWSASGQLLQRLTGHTNRLGKVAFHPCGSYLGTASFDGTWRLWDVESGEAILEQEGHSRAVYALAFHPDGSLALSGGLDAYGRVWDLRTGRSIMVLEGHIKGILSTAVSPNGYHMATSSEDNTARIWDLRKRTCLYTLPAHQSSVAHVAFEPENGHYLVSASFDRLAKVWSTKSFKLLRKLAGHEGHVSGCDISSDGTNSIATVSQDRTIKLWSPEESIEEIKKEMDGV